MHVEVTGATVRSETLLVDTAGEDAEQPQHAIAAAALALWPIPLLLSFVLAGGERQLGETGADEQGGGGAIGAVHRNRTENPNPPSRRPTRKRKKTGNWENGETVGTTVLAENTETGLWDRTGTTAAAGVTVATWDQGRQH